MKKKNLHIILLLVVAFGLIFNTLFQLYLLNELDDLWGELIGLDELLADVFGYLEDLSSSRYGQDI